MSIRNWESDMEIKRKIAAGWVVNDKGILVPPQPSTQKSRLISKTSDPDYFADTLLYEIRKAETSVIECYKDLERHLTRIEERITKKRKVKKI